jgi:hypothetical protein
MPSNDPTSPTAGSGDPADAVRRLQERLDQASARAERLINDAAAATAARKPPPAGWQKPNHGDERPPLGGDLELLTQLLQSLRDLVPPELERRLAEALRELLMALRALIDFYLERLERRAPEPTEAEDIPIA